MNGIYIHIPFCKSKCHYCDFYSVTTSFRQPVFVEALLREVEFRSDYLPAGEVDTIYFGGGTPTLLQPAAIEAILTRLKQFYTLTPDVEITLEANPDDLNEEILTGYLGLGINRMSIGIQSFDNEYLEMMNRRHNAQQAVESVYQAYRAGFRRLSIDLIYGIPGMTPENWERNLEKAVSLPAGHLSAYHLTIEPNTRFGQMKRTGQLTEIADEESLNQYEMLLKMAADGGFEQYEISNFARNGEYSRHNAKYWTGEPYIGLGPSAHSYNGTHRHWNAGRLAGYLRDCQERKMPEGEFIDPVMRQNEYVMTRLRTAKGLDINAFEIEFGHTARLELLETIQPHIHSGSLIMQGTKLFFDPVAWFRSDSVLADLFRIG
jgi:oxygen-independent coproporphyrinogen-3 oxidase